MGNVKIASQAYVDRQIEGNKTKITSDGLYSGESAVDAEDVVPSMKYAKDTYRKKDDLAYEDTSLALKKEVVGLVEDSKMFVGAENFTSQVIETVGEALAGDEDLKSAIEKAINEVASKMNSIATKEDLKQYLPVANVKGTQSAEVNAVYSAAYINKQLADIADNFSSIDEDMGDYRKNSDFKYDNNGVEETIAFESYVDSKFMSGDKEKYALAGHDHGSKYPQASNIVDENEGEPLASFEGVKIPTVEKVTNMLAGYAKEYATDKDESTRVVRQTELASYVKEEKVVVYDKGKEASAGQVYSALSMKAVLDKEYIINTESPTEEEKAYSASFVDGNFAKKPGEGKSYLTSDAISPAEGETVSETTMLPSTGRAKEIAKGWFDENYEVVE